jgi:DNA-binding CsgD family transcriptional regulator
VHRSTASTSENPRELLERSRQLSALHDGLAAVVTEARGRIVLLGGEAGVGKTALLRRFCDERRRSVRILWGNCDALFTPRPLGPLLEIAERTGGELEEHVRGDARPHEVAAALTRELGREPTILVLEDVHWADEATLDVLRLLGRKIEAVPAFVVASYRDDELDRTHPLRIVLGDLTTRQMVGRLKVQCLSPEAVTMLAEPLGVDADKLYGNTGGNPFFVTEVLAAGEEEIAPTVRDAVLSRAARLSPAATALLETVAVVPPRIELWLLEALAGEALDLGECLSSGILVHEPEGIAFRHELARLAVEESVPPNRSIVLHQKALAALASPPTGDLDLARLAHHAEAAGDTDAVVQFAPVAAERAASLGAHREAAAQYGRALRFADGLPLKVQAELLERRSYECYLTDQFNEAIEAQKNVLELQRKLADRLAEGAALCTLAKRVWCAGRTAEAAEVSSQAVALLEELPPGRELAMAYSVASAACLNSEDAEGTASWGARALELAESLDDTEILIYALNNIGTMKLLSGDMEGTKALDRSLRLAQSAELEDQAGRAFIHFGWVLARTRAYALEDRITAGIEYSSERGLDLWWLYLLAYRARSELDRGRWDEAAASAGFVLGNPRDAVLLRTIALVVLGLVRARRGDPEVWPLLDEALALTEHSKELQHIAPVAAARAEAAWLDGNHETVAAETKEAMDLAVKWRSPWAIGELAYWRSQAGVQAPIPTGAAEPYALQLAGDWAQASAAWTEVGCPYEAALALADSDDEDALRRGLDELHALGALPAAAIVARRLRKRGVRGLPRGPRPATQRNPANLTSRELEVLTLVAQGHRNATIAERLFLAEKTVDHHVSAVLRKLGVRTRGQASAEAVRLGVAAQDR